MTSTVNQNAEDQLITWFEDIPKIFTTLFTFAAGITFSLLFQKIDPESPLVSQWGIERSYQFIAIAWLFFLVGLIISYILAIGSVYGGRKFENALRGPFGIIVRVAFGSLPILAGVAFLFLSLVICAYQRAVGITGAAISGTGVLLSLLGLMIDICR